MCRKLSFPWVHGNRWWEVPLWDKVKSCTRHIHIFRTRKCAKNRTISRETKINILKCYVWSTLLYGCERWTLTADLRRTTNAFVMWCLRWMERIPYTDHKTNEEVLDLTCKNLKISKTITKKKLSFFGHLVSKAKMSPWPSAERSLARERREDKGQPCRSSQGWQQRNWQR